MYTEWVFIFIHNNCSHFSEINTDGQQDGWTDRNTDRKIIILYLYYPNSHQNIFKHHYIKWYETKNPENAKVDLPLTDMYKMQRSWKFNLFII